MFKPGTRSAPVYSTYTLDSSGTRGGISPNKARERIVNEPVTFQGVDGTVPVVLGPWRSQTGTVTVYLTVDRFDLVWHGKREQGEIPSPFAPPTKYDLTSVYAPPARNSMFALTTIGETATFTRAGKSPDGFPFDAAIERQTYLGQHRISVAGGTYDTCKFAIDSTSRPVNSPVESPASQRRFEWYAKGSGVLVLVETPYRDGDKDVKDVEELQAL